MRKTVHPAERLAPGEQRIAGVGLGEQIGVVAHRNNGIGLWIQSCDAIEKRLHHLAAGGLASMDGGRQREGVELAQVIGVLRIGRHGLEW